MPPCLLCLHVERNNSNEEPPRVGTTAFYDSIAVSAQREIDGDNHGISNITELCKECTVIGVKAMLDINTEQNQIEEKIRNQYQM